MRPFRTANQPLTIQIESMAVEIETHIGAMAFRLKGAARAVLPALELRPVTMNDGLLVLTASEADSPAYLVVDHRREEDGAAASVEFWEPVGAGEVPLGGLFAFCDPAVPAKDGQEVETLDELRGLCESASAEGLRVA